MRRHLRLSALVGYLVKTHNNKIQIFRFSFLAGEISLISLIIHTAQRCMNDRSGITYQQIPIARYFCTVEMAAMVAEAKGFGLVVMPACNGHGHNNPNRP
jgi:hypothetical protein